ncbi:MAG TPA: diacylglycerol kinase family protein [Massilibacterium sp.]|nr:diacylglycerol kinase family protein [Massilibacterium sp.]
MDLKDKKQKEKRRLFRSFSYAFLGIKHTIQIEKNMRIHLLASFIVLILMIFLPLKKVEIAILCMVIGMVFALEMVNTAIENVVDLVTKEYRPLAKIAKDVAAGAVLIFVLFAVIIGVLILGPPVVSLFF